MLRTEPEPVVLLTTLVFLSLIELDTYLHRRVVEWLLSWRR